MVSRFRKAREPGQEVIATGESRLPEDAARIVMTAVCLPGWTSRPAERLSVGVGNG